MEANSSDPPEDSPHPVVGGVTAFSWSSDSTTSVISSLCVLSSASDQEPDAPESQPGAAKPHFNCFEKSLSVSPRCSTEGEKHDEPPHSTLETLARSISIVSTLHPRLIESNLFELWSMTQEERCNHLKSACRILYLQTSRPNLAIAQQALLFLHMATMFGAVAPESLVWTKQATDLLQKIADYWRCNDAGPGSWVVLHAQYLLRRVALSHRLSEHLEGNFSLDRFLEQVRKTQLWRSGTWTLNVEEHLVILGDLLSLAQDALQVVTSNPGAASLDLTPLRCVALCLSDANSLCLATSFLLLQICLYMGANGETLAQAKLKIDSRREKLANMKDNAVRIIAWLLTVIEEHTKTIKTLSHLMSSVAPWDAHSLGMDRPPRIARCMTSSEMTDMTAMARSEDYPVPSFDSVLSQNHRKLCMRFQNYMCSHGNLKIEARRRRQLSVAKANSGSGSEIQSSIERRNPPDKSGTRDRIIPVEIVHIHAQIPPASAEGTLSSSTSFAQPMHLKDQQPTSANVHQSMTNDEYELCNPLPRTRLDVFGDPQGMFQERTGESKARVAKGKPDRNIREQHRRMGDESKRTVKHNGGMMCEQNQTPRGCVPERLQPKSPRPTQPAPEGIGVCEHEQEGLVPPRPIKGSPHSAYSHSEDSSFDSGSSSEVQSSGTDQESDSSDDTMNDRKTTNTTMAAINDSIAVSPHKVAGPQHGMPLKESPQKSGARPDEIPFNDLVLESRIGVGAFAEVYAGKWRGKLANIGNMQTATYTHTCYDIWLGTRVAIKRLLTTNTRDKEVTNVEKTSLGFLVRTIHDPSPGCIHLSSLGEEAKRSLLKNSTGKFKF